MTSDSRVWRPYTQMLHAPPPISISRAEGVYLETEDGRRILDGVSSWWVNVHGHNHPRLNKALVAQTHQLQQVIFAGFTNEPAERLAFELVKRTPQGLDHVFYSDDGSTAVEAGLKMAYQYWRNRGETGRDLFVSLVDAYHGDTFGAMSVGGVDMFHATFRRLLFPTRRIAHPDSPDKGTSLEKIIETDGHRIAAVIIEPTLQGAAGMVMWPDSFLRSVRQGTKDAGIPLIADEVFTGFGRTGPMFACEHGPIEPDIMCLSKALTGGYLPLGATLCSSEIYEAFLSETPGHTLLHGHSFTGNALSCAVGLEGLALFDEEGRLAQVATLEALFTNRLKEIATLPAVQSVRNIGGMAAMDLAPQGAGGYFDTLGPRLYSEFLKRDILLRPLGNTLYFLPPYVIGTTDVHRVFDAITEVIREL